MSVQCERFGDTADIGRCAPRSPAPRARTGRPRGRRGHRHRRGAARAPRTGIGRPDAPRRVDAARMRVPAPRCARGPCAPRTVACGLRILGLPPPPHPPSEEHRHARPRADLPVRARRADEGRARRRHRHARPRGVRVRAPARRGEPARDLHLPRDLDRGRAVRAEADLRRGLRIGRPVGRRDRGALRGVDEQRLRPVVPRLLPADLARVPEGAHPPRRALRLEGGRAAGRHRAGVADARALPDARRDRVDDGHQGRDAEGARQRGDAARRARRRRVDRRELVALRQGLRAPQGPHPGREVDRVVPLHEAVGAGPGVQEPRRDPRRVPHRGHLAEGHRLPVLLQGRARVEHLRRAEGGGLLGRADVLRLVERMVPGAGPADRVGLPVELRAARPRAAAGTVRDGRTVVRRAAQDVGAGDGIGRQPGSAAMRPSQAPTAGHASSDSFASGSASTYG